MVVKILHLSDGSLPDWRIEKAAISSRNLGYEVYFAGNPITGDYKSVFKKHFAIQWTSRSRNYYPFYWHSLKKQMKYIIKQVNPDVIHAHNVFSAKMAKEIGGYPMVYDNHEYWSVYLKRQAESDMSYTSSKRFSMRKSTIDPIKRIAKDYLKTRYVKMWSRIEKELVSTTPTITVSNTIVNDLQKLGNRIYLVPNFPMQEEICWIPRPEYPTLKSCIYAGVEPVGEKKAAHRNLNGFVNLFENDSIGKLFIIGWNGASTAKVHYLGFMTRIQMYTEMQKHSVGLIPFRPHWSHVFISPNKAYEYAHAGLFVISSSGFIPIFDILGNNCLSFDDYLDLKVKLQHTFEDMEKLYLKRVQTYEFARENLLWEKFEGNIFESYKYA